MKSRSNSLDRWIPGVVATDMNLVLTNIPPPPLGTNRGPPWPEKIKKISGVISVEGGTIQRFWDPHSARFWVDFMPGGGCRVRLGGVNYLHSRYVNDPYASSPDIHPISRKSIREKNSRRSLGDFLEIPKISTRLIKICRIGGISRFSALGTRIN